MTKISVDEARCNLDALIDRAKAGEEVILSRGDVEVRLVPVEAQPTRDRVFGSMRGDVYLTDAFFEPLTEDEVAAWYR